MWASLIDLVFPPHCAACDSPGDYFCDGCRGQVVPIPQPVCDRCGDPLRRPVEPSTDMDMRASVCAECREHPPHYDLARSVLVFDGGIRHAIHALKYRGKKAVSGTLGALLADLAPSETTAGIGAVVPVPLHPHRQACRGFNQAELLARPLSARLGVPCIVQALRRLHQESPQAELDADARRRNVRGAFGPGKSPPPATVLLVDDVFSTGATADACAHALKQGGASRVLVLTLARPMPPAARRQCAPGPPSEGRIGLRAR